MVWGIAGGGELGLAGKTSINKGNRGRYLFLTFVIAIFRAGFFLPGRVFQKRRRCRRGGSAARRAKAEVSSGRIMGSTRAWSTQGPGKLGTASLTSTRCQ